MVLPYIIARSSDRILIRAYFHAKNDPENHAPAPKSWADFINQFCDPPDLHHPRGHTALHRYLSNTFSLEFESTEDLKKVVPPEELEELAKRYGGVKNQEVLARNDALLTLAVYGRRGQKGESRRGSEFGLRTWWLTGETAILGKARELVAARQGDRFMMRPEFLLNFIALSPSTEQVRSTFRTVFPSLLGIRLSNRMAREPFADLMKKVDEAMGLEEGRRQAAIAKLSDDLKSDFRREYSRGVV